MPAPLRWFVFSHDTELKFEGFFFFLEVLISELLQLWQTGAWASVTALVSQVHYNFLWKSGEQSFLEELNPPLFSRSLLTLAVFHWDCDWAGAISNPPQKKIPSSSFKSNLASDAHRLKYHCTYKLVTKVNCQVAWRNEDLITGTGCIHASWLLIWKWRM